MPKASDLKKGDVVFGGLPGQSAFYTDQATVLAAHGDTQLLSESLQIQPHPIKGYRGNIGIYTIQKDFRVPAGLVHSNPEYGVGGGQQFFIKFYSSQLTLTDELSLEQYYANQVSRNYFRR